jgi:hypothetical protein
MKQISTSYSMAVLHFERIMEYFHNNRCRN